MAAQKKIDIVLNNIKYQVQIQNVRGQIWAHLNGRTICYEPAGSEQKRKSSEKKINSGDLLAPMPGKITKIFKIKNDQISKGDAVLVMEAMKMEYTLKSGTDGKVESLNCAVGDQVSLGKVLAHIKSEFPAVGVS